MTIEITILSENYASKVNSAEWGFSALVDISDTKILFDTGQNGDCVINNSSELDIDLKEIDYIVLSHGHYDHTGGLKKIIEHIGKKKIILHPKIFLNKYSIKNSKMIEANTLDLTSINIDLKDLIINCSEQFKINEHTHVISDIPFTNNYESISKHFVIKEREKATQDNFDDELVLVIDSKNGLIVLTGCAHRGIINILGHVKNKFNKNIYAVIGGTHLYKASDEHFNFVVDYFKNEDIKIISPCHCTGINRIFDLKNIFKERVKPSFCGEKLLFKE